MNLFFAISLYLDTGFQRKENGNILLVVAQREYFPFGSLITIQHLVVFKDVPQEFFHLWNPFPGFVQIATIPLETTRINQ